MERSRGGVDAVRLEIYRHLFTALTEEMGAALRRAAYSPNIKERRDYSCALFDSRGRVVAMGDHMPVHLGAMPMSVAAALTISEPVEPGDVIVLNDPFAGGTHLPDITVVSCVTGASSDAEPAGRPVAYLAVRAHHADVGGMTPGSMPLAREIYQEGLRIPPIRLVRRGQRVADVWRLLLANVRTPAEREGDLDAQLAALTTGEQRLHELIERRGTDDVEAAMEALLAYADRLIRAGIRRIPDGVYDAQDVLDDDGFGSGPLPIRVRMEIRGDHAILDFSGTAAQADGGVNAVAAISSAAARYAFRCVLEAMSGESLPAGGGEMSALEFVMPERSIVSPRLPASVAAGNVETSQRITDVLLEALAIALPDLLPAQSQGTMNNVTVGGSDPRTGRSFAYYETIAGGTGGGPTGPGLSGVHSHMTNSLNTPIEALEHAYPLRVPRYALRRGSGGRGRHPGGDGVRRDLELLVDAEVSILSERRTRPPAGRAGGEPALSGENYMISAGGERSLPGKVTLRARAGDVISIRTPGGGGWGPPG